MPLAADDNPSAQSSPADVESHPIDVGKKTGLPATGLPARPCQGLAHLLKRMFVGKGDDARARLLLGSGYSNHADYEGLYYYARSAVLLDANGQPDGNELCFDRSWRLVRTVPWRNGVKEGLELVSEGDTRQEIPWKDGKVDGVRKTYYPDGTLQSEATYVAGVADGPSRTYDRSGALARECMMKGGKRDGPMTDYWAPDKQPKRIVQYKDGKVVGTLREFYLNGKIKREVPFVDDVMQGEEKLYDETGAPTATKYWLDGKCVSKEDYEKKGK